jgi:hypothetical protein
MLLGLLLGLALAGTACGHGMMTSPMPRNSRDWNATVDGNGKPFAQHDHCNAPHGASKGTPREQTGSGQSCLWFSQGCTIGCETCDNHTQHTNGKSLCPLPGPPPPPGPAPTCTLTEAKNFQGDDLLCRDKVACPVSAKDAGACCDMCGSKPADAEPQGVCSAWTYWQGKCYLKAGKGNHSVAGGGMVSGVVMHRGAPWHSWPPGVGESPMEPTITSPLLRTMFPTNGTGADDAYRYNPWRAPGFAPTVDACGMAGGRHTTDPGGGDADFETTTFAKMGDHGSQVLKPGPAMTHWTAGTTVEVAWAIRYSERSTIMHALCRLSRN